MRCFIVKLRFFGGGALASAPLFGVLQTYA